MSSSLEACRELEEIVAKHPLMEYYRHVFANSHRWNGIDSIEGKKVLVYMEQGFGDVIQFLRYLPLLVKYYKCQVIVYCPDELKRLIPSTFGTFHSKYDPDLPDHDCHILSFCLPFFLQNGGYLKLSGSGHTQFPYLRPTLGTINEDIRKEEGFKIGICWEGSANSAARSIPLKYFKKLQTELDAKLFCLQREIKNQYLIEGAEDLELFGVELNDFHDTAEAIMAMDAVVSIETSVLHLTGALNKSPSYGLITAGSDGRFGVDGRFGDKEYPKWYPSLRLIKVASKTSDPSPYAIAMDKVIEYLRPYKKK